MSEKDIRPKAETEADEIVYDESVCSPEFTEGCTMPASEQAE